MCRTTCLLIAVLTLSTGCGNKHVATREQATLAALSTYPGNPVRSDEVQLAAIDNPKDKEIELINLTDRTIPTPTIWVNQAYVHKAPTIKPRGQVTVDYAELIEQGQGVRDLDMANVLVRKVEVQTGDALYTVMGPSRK